MAERGGCLLGLDLGTTSLKAGLFGLDGTTIAIADRGYPTHRPAPGHVEQAPADWLAALDGVLGDLLAKHEGDVLGGSICSQVQTHVFVDAAGMPVAPAITWQDSRAEAEAAELDAAVTPGERRLWWADAMAVNATHTLPRMLWMSRHRPDTWARTYKVLSPKDFCLRHLTGRWSADPLGCFDLVDRTGAYVTRLIARVAGAAERLPALAWPRDPMGMATHPRFGGRAVPFVCGTMDAWAGLFGSGAAEPGAGAYFSGTSEIVMLIDDKPGGAPGVVSFIPLDGWHVHAGPTQSGGDTLRWIAAMFGRSIEQTLAAAAAADENADIVFLPHLGGERAPLWDPHARGTFLGLTGATGFPEMARAALEGVACSGEMLFAAAASAAGRAYPVLHLGGKGALSDLWAQIRADILRTRLRRTDCLDNGIIGAAILADSAGGDLGSVREAAARMVRIDREFLPDPARAERSARLRQRYRTAYETLRPYYRG
ncbi:MAG TPA: FGGY family carbohydrate kinase [Sphingomonas sp.]